MNRDKYIHAAWSMLAFFGLYFLFGSETAFVGVFTLGFGIELGQSRELKFYQWDKDRLYDMVANMSGAIVGWLFLIIIKALL